MVADPDSRRLPLPGAVTVAFCLSVMALVAVAAGLGAAVAVLVVHVSTGVQSWLTLVWMVGVLALGCGAGAALWALAVLCRQGHEQALALRRAAAALERLAGGGGVDGGEPPGRAADLQEVLAQLRELNLNVLLTNRQRQEKRRRLIDRQVERLTRGAEEALAAGDVDSAGEHLERLEAVAPDGAAAAELRRRVEQARWRARADDIAGTAARVEDLMATGGFEQAESAADALLSRHPASPEAIALLARVRREREALLTERRTELYGRVQSAASARQWREALAAAREFLESFADSVEAGAVRAQMETLASNARIEEVRELRDRIREFIDRRRFAEAVELARQVVERFPDTAAAAELRQQMPRLEERARAAGGGSA